MQVHAKTPHISVDIQGDEIPDTLMDAVREVFTDSEIEVVDGDDETMSVYDTELYRDTAAEMIPGDVVRIHRENHGWSQAELGEKLGGVSRQRVSDFETGRRGISKSVAIRLGELFNIPVDSILKYEKA